MTSVPALRQALVSAGSVAPMFEEPALVQEFCALRALADARRRGPEFEQLVRRLFQQAHFNVTFDPAAAAPRQTDLVATYGNATYLIETKWWKKRAGVGAVDEVRTRLAETNPSVTGVLISVSGFGDGAVERVERRRERPVLLIDGEELETVLRAPEELQELLRRKRDELMVHARAFATGSARSDSPRSDALPVDQVSFLIDGKRQAILTSSGDFGQFVFVQNMPDIDWTAGGGSGVHIDMSFAPGTAEGLIDVLHKLVDAGWATGRGRWNIQQASRNWHGAGVASLVDAIRGWRERYEGIEPIHHTEQLCWQDTRGEGLAFYTLTAGIDGHERRQVWQCDVSLQLQGVPLNPEPVRNFASLLGVHEQRYFRARSGASVERHHLRGEEALEPLGYVVYDQPNDPEDPEWVCGVIVRNPWFAGRYESRSELPEWLPGHVDSSELLICALGQYHPVGFPVDEYRFRWCEWAWTSDALVFHPVADWDFAERSRR
jgi:hypothetical protein